VLRLKQGDLYIYSRGARSSSTSGKRGMVVCGDIGYAGSKGGVRGFE
jgi:hypothetical protein